MRSATIKPLGIRIVQGLYRRAAARSLTRFELRTRRATDVNDRTLRDILALNAATRFGEDHGLPVLRASANVARAYVARMPLTTMRDYEPYVERIVCGERRVLTGDRVAYLAGSAGTTSVGKRLPKTERARRKQMFFLPLVLQGALERRFPSGSGVGRGVNLMSAYRPEPVDDEAPPLMTSNNSGMRRMQPCIEHLWCSPKEVFGVPDQATAHYLHALFALTDPDARFLIALFAAQLSWWFEIIEARRESLLADIANGKLQGDLRLSDARRGAIERRLQPAPERARVLRDAFARGDDGIVARIWPDMRYIAAVTSGSFGVYKERIAVLTGGRIPVVSPCHASSECVIGINLDMANEEYVLTLGAAHYEFIPLENAGLASPATVDIESLEVGRRYEVVMTTWSGLFRYRLDDVIEITGFHNAAPKFLFLCRGSLLLDLVGEKTGERHVAGAVKAAVRRVAAQPGLFYEYTMTARLVSERPRYECYLELDCNAPDSKLLCQIAAAIEEELCTANAYYRRQARDFGRFEPLLVKRLQRGAFAAYRRRLARRASAPDAAQLKIPPISHDSPALQTLERRVVATSAGPPIG